MNVGEGGKVNEREYENWEETRGTKEGDHKKKDRGKESIK